MRNKGFCSNVKKLSLFEKIIDTKSVAFIGNIFMASVSLVNASSDLREALQNALMLIGLQNCIKPKDIVLLKPNLHGGPGHTSPQMLEALVQWAWETGRTRNHWRRALLGLSGSPTVFSANRLI